MKYTILTALLALSACVRTTFPDTHPAAPMPEGPIASGFNDSSMTWICQQKEVNQSLVWVECNFYNGAPFTQTACIEVNYYHEKTMAQVSSNGPVCSGLLSSGQDHQKYVAIRGEDRAQLTNNCGADLGGCVMLAEKAE